MGKNVILQNSEVKCNFTKFRGKNVILFFSDVEDQTILQPQSILRNKRQKTISEE